MSSLQNFLIPLLIYIFAARYSLLASNKRIGSALFFLVNIGAFAWMSMLVPTNTGTYATIPSFGTEVILRHLALIGTYVLAVTVGYFLMRSLAEKETFVLAALYPIFLLISLKYFPKFWGELLDGIDWPEWTLTAAVVGLSYMAFRLSYLVVEVRNGTAATPTLSEYLGFAFFLPTLLVGPINRYSVHQSSIEAIGETRIPIERALLRVIVGITKYFFLANLANQLSYTGIFMDGKPHGVFDLFVAIVFYYLFLYLNFSGFCDIAIGIAALIGIRVNENFNNPFAARNVKDFWNRWHITLSQYARDVIFTPFSTFLVRKFGVRHTNSSIAVTILVVFLVIGIWHGVGWQFAVFGLFHAVGVITNHYYTIWMKRKLGKERYRLYDRNRVVNFFAIVLTFIYVASSFAIFANSREMIGIIWNGLRAGLQT